MNKLSNLTRAFKLIWAAVSYPLMVLAYEIVSAAILFIYWVIDSPEEFKQKLDDIEYE